MKRSYLFCNKQIKLKYLNSNNVESHHFKDLKATQKVTTYNVHESQIYEDIKKKHKIKNKTKLYTYIHIFMT